MRRPDYERKARLLKDGKVKQVKDFRNKLSHQDIDLIEMMEEEFLFMTEQHFSSEDYSECKRIISATYSRNRRLKERIGYYLSLGKCYFLTLTFDTRTLSNTNQDTRKQYVRKWLKSNCELYVANIDFGGDKGREHYHAVVYPGAIFMNYDKWHKYGAIKSEVIIRPSNDETRVKLAKYVSKLTNHAIKETTRRNAMIYSRTPVQ